MAEPISIGVSTRWLAELAARLGKIRDRRRKELSALRDVYLGDPLELVQRYIEPTVQAINPLEHRDKPFQGESSYAVPLRKEIKEFIDLKIIEHDGRNVLFLLADAGMGKTSALVILKLLEISAFWPRGYRFELFKLGPETLSKLSAIEDKNDAILLLDALDEDPEAYGRIEKRLEELLHLTKNFRRTVITCRTQFIPALDQAPFGDRRYASFAGSLLRIRYLSPFTDKQVESYIKKVFLRGRWRIFKNQEKIYRARSVIASISSLKMRPLILSYIEDLIELPKEARSEIFLLYNGLVDRWLLRETSKLWSKYKHRPPSVKGLRILCESLAIRLHLDRMSSATVRILREILSEKDTEDLEVLDFGGRSLLNKDSAGAFRFAHRTIEEFLIISYIVRRAVEDPSLKWVVKAEIPASDEMVSMFFSFSRLAANELRFKLPGMGEVSWKTKGEQINWIARLSEVLSIESQQTLPSIGWQGEISVSPAVAISILNRHFNLQNVGRFLGDIDLSHASLKGANLEDYNLAGACFDYADLEGVWEVPEVVIKYVDGISERCQ